MKSQYRYFLTIGVAAAALFAQIASAQAPAPQAPQPSAGGAPGRGRGPGPVRQPDPRVQQRTYHFADADKDMPYALYVSSKVTKAKAAPLIVALHGMGGDHNSLLRGNAIDLAEGGYILVGPMGYNPQGWFGSPVIRPRRGGPGGQQAANDPPNLRELSEKDVMNVSFRSWQIRGKKRQHLRCETGRDAVAMISIVCLERVCDSETSQGLIELRVRRQERILCSDIDGDRAIAL